MYLLPLGFLALELLGFLLWTVLHKMTLLFAPGTVRLQAVHDETGLVQSVKVLLWSSCKKPRNKSRAPGLGTTLEPDDVFLVFDALEIDQRFIPNEIGLHGYQMHLKIIVSEGVFKVPESDGGASAGVVNQILLISMLLE